VLAGRRRIEFLKMEFQKMDACRNHDARKKRVG
jgi:hypothetical protein